ncbi:MAG: hydroxyphenylacetyl-CoA thioesterase PaaI [Sporichthyaceae bacterium]
MSQVVPESDPAAVADAVTHAMMINDRASAAAGIRVVSVIPGEVVTQMTVMPHQVNGHGVCHGGVLFHLADTAFGLCCNAPGPPAVAAACDIVFVRPAREGEVLWAHASTRSLAGRNGVYDVSVTRRVGADVEVVAEFRGRSRVVGHAQPGSDGRRIAQSGA